MTGSGPRICMIGALGALTLGCSQEGRIVADDHVTCAAMISAADRLVATEQVAPDEAVTRDGLLAMMTHLNAWAIPNDVSEKEAFARLNLERDRLTETVPPKDVVTRAHACIASAQTS